ncbi:uncharacterized protein LOC133383326 isoform X2 [Rhineura floridana]|uniref:uncharacterized protein LOC133383326 isoform X2 n=1 Tax=Rhineura floridana TaxID=261503 RepID=UPI002AC81E3B|nr:uncharacterized protein LOC133383326 isoform X2 [Rhineura floridana]
MLTAIRETTVKVGLYMLLKSGFLQVRQPSSMTNNLEWGNNCRQKGYSKVIFFLQCTGLAQLSSYVIGGAYNFSSCNHPNIMEDYQNVLKKNILDSLKNIQIQPESALLACIHNFTKKCVAPQHSGIWNATDVLLRKNCDGYSENNGSQNVQVIFRDSIKCNSQRKKEECGNRTSLELNEMWNSYLRNISRSP